MKKLITLLLAAALVLSLAACGGGSDTPSTDTNTNTPSGGRIESKGLFVLEAHDNFDLSNEKDLSEQETYLIHVYDIIPDSVKNADMGQGSYQYTATLNNANTYESITTSGGSALTNFIFSSRYAVDVHVGTVFGGSEPIRTISAFRVNKNDINDNTTVKIEIDDSDIYDCTIDFERSDIQEIDILDKIFNIEDSPYEYQLASTMYTRKNMIRNAINYLNNNGGLGNSETVIGILAALEVNAMSNISVCLNGNAEVIYYDFSTDTFLHSDNLSEYGELSAEELLNAVNNIYPEILESTQNLIANNNVLIENIRICNNPDTYSDEALQVANLAINNIEIADKAINDFFLENVNVN